MEDRAGPRTGVSTAHTAPLASCLLMDGGVYAGRVCLLQVFGSQAARALLAAHLPLYQRLLGNEGRIDVEGRHVIHDHSYLQAQNVKVGLDMRRHSSLRASVTIRWPQSSPTPGPEDAIWCNVHSFVLLSGCMWGGTSIWRVAAQQQSRQVMAAALWRHCASAATQTFKATENTAATTPPPADAAAGCASVPLAAATAASHLEAVLAVLQYVPQQRGLARAQEARQQRDRQGLAWTAPNLLVGGFDVRVHRPALAKHL